MYVGTGFYHFKNIPVLLVNDSYQFVCIFLLFTDLKLFGSQFQLIHTDLSTFRPIFTDLGADSVIRTDSSMIRPVFMDPGVPVKNSKSMIHTNSCVFRLVLRMFEYTSLELLMTHTDSSVFREVLHRSQYQKSQFHV